MSITRGLAGFHDKARLAADRLRALERHGVATEPLERILLALLDGALEAWFWRDESGLERLSGRMDETTHELLRRLDHLERELPEPARCASVLSLPSRSAPATRRTGRRAPPARAGREAA